MINSLTNAVVQGVQTRAANNRTNRGENAGFDSVMAGVSSANEPRQDRQRDNREPIRNDRPAESAGRSENNTTTEQSQNHTSGVEQTAETQAITDAAADYAPALDDADQELVLAEMAAILGITMEALQEILQKLEMPLEALGDAENRALVLMTAEDMESQVELLNYPEALPVLEGLKRVSENHNLHNRPPTQLFDGESFDAIETDLAIGEPVQEVMEVPAHANATTTQNTANTNTTADLAATKEAVAPVAENLQTTIGDIMPAAIHSAAVEVPVQSNVASTQSIPMAMASPVVTPQTIADQIVQQVRFVSGEGMAEMRIQLKPEHLGDLTMRIATINGIVTAQFTAENQRVKELIEAGFNNLRDSLEQAGINIADIEVNVRNENDPHEFMEFGREVSDRRIRDMMAAAMADEEAAAPTPTVAEVEENAIDYQV
ncbi:MAG: flagellar hook-length control protein FliK [Defluviitaleaceae bacterium]|nr:flagellar hook-length control protein FliK [Defluviitaleaceae bacterium]